MLSFTYTYTNSFSCFGQPISKTAHLPCDRLSSLGWMSSWVSVIFILTVGGVVIVLAVV